MCKRAFFFDMDGVLFNSMPYHAIAWERVMAKYGLPFSARDCYLNEGRTGESIIHEAIWKHEHREASAEEMAAIYKEKSTLFHTLGDAKPIEGVYEVLRYIQSRDCQIWIVTGSAQQSLFDKLDVCFHGIFTRERMITALDVQHGKPSPEPYLKAWERSGLPKEQCAVIENAPMGVESGKAAGLTVYAVNTGVLSADDLWKANADEVFGNMEELLRYIQSSVLPL